MFPFFPFFGRLISRTWTCQTTRVSGCGLGKLYHVNIVAWKTRPFIGIFIGRNEVHILLHLFIEADMRSIDHTGEIYFSRTRRICDCGWSRHEWWDVICNKVLSHRTAAAAAGGSGKLWQCETFDRMLLQFPLFRCCDEIVNWLLEAWRKSACVWKKFNYFYSF